MDELERSIGDLVIANRILAKEDVVDAYGHVSIRHPQKPDHYLLSRSLSPEFVTKGDIIEFKLDGTPVNDANLGTELIWDYDLDGDLNLLSTEWSMFGTTSRAIFEADVIDGRCGEGTISFIIDDGSDYIGCDSIEVSATYWEWAAEVYD